MAFYLVHKSNKLRFKIIGLDKATMVATLQGDSSPVPFTQSVKQDNLDKYGYSIVKVDEDAPVPATPNTV